MATVSSSQAPPWNLTADVGPGSSASLDQSSPLALARFFADRADARVKPVLDEFRKSLTELQHRVDKLGDGSGAGERASIPDVQALQRSIANLTEQIHSKADAEPVKLLLASTRNSKAEIMALQAASQRESPLVQRLQDMEAALSLCSSGFTRKLNANEQSTTNELKELRKMIEELIARCASTERTSTEALQQLHSTCSKHSSQLGSVERSLEQKAGLSQLEQTAALAVSTDRRLNETDRAIKNLDTLVSALGNRADNLQQQEVLTNNQLRQTEGVITNFQAQLGEIERLLNDRPTNAHIGKLRGSLADLEAKYIEMERSLGERPNSIQMQALKSTLGTVEAKVHLLEQSAQERTLLALQEKPLKPIVVGLQGQLAALDQAMREKVDSEDIKQLKRSYDNIEGQLSKIERAMGEKASVAQVQQLQATFDMVEAKLDDLDQDRQINSASTFAEMHASSQAVVELQSKVMRIERSVLEGMDCMHQLERVISEISSTAVHSSNTERSMGQKLASAERSVRESMEARAEDQERLRRLEAHFSLLRHSVSVAARTGFRSDGGGVVPAGDFSVSVDESDSPFGLHMKRRFVG